MADKTFIDGLIFKAPRATAPSFVKGSLSVKVEAFAAFAAQHQKDGWLNIDLKESKGGKYYAELNTWEKGKKDNGGADAGQDSSEADPGVDDIPF